MQEPQVKNQHFVPKFILRRFSADGRSVTSLLLSTGQTVPQASIKTQCSKRYFYGEEQDLEKAFAVQENDVAPLIQRLVTQEDFSFSSEDERYLLISFLHMLRFRTLHMGERLLRVANLAFQEVMPLVKPHYTSVVKRFHVTHDYPHLEALKIACASTFAYMDLSWCVLSNSHREPFVLSDHPVVVYNIMCEKLAVLSQHYTSSCGLDAQGLLVFFPLDCSHCLLLFDETVYQRKSNHKSRSTVSRSDLKYINSLQAVHATNCLYWGKKVPNSEIIKSLLAVRRKWSDKTKAQMEVLEGGARQEKTSKILRHTVPDLRVGLNLSFLQLRPKLNTQIVPSGLYPPRSWYLRQGIQTSIDDIDARIEREKAARVSRV